MDNYLKGRKIKLTYAGHTVERDTTKGCVQGSIGGPILWNLLLDPLLRELQVEGVHVQAFADDVLLISEGETGQEIQMKLNRVLARVYKWGVQNKLRFAPHKTKAMVVTRKLKYDDPILSMNGEPIKMEKSIRILGVEVDSALTFNAHVNHVCNKAIGIYKQLCRTAKVGWGLNQEVRATIYTAVVEPIIMYASAVWAKEVGKVCLRKKLENIQRSFAQKIARCYKTVSCGAATVLAGILPLDLRIKEAAELYEARTERNVDPDDEQIESRTPYHKLPHPMDRPSIKYSDAEIPVQTAIYTDGSKTPNGVGAAWVYIREGVEVKTKKIKLAPYCTVRFRNSNGQNNVHCRDADHPEGLEAATGEILQRNSQKN
ncbi:unnamed protein product [Pieris macdunnoughi]|uniref:Reverse transcriptase domain-containing protein n=1 Tax=Pieris macdunnoughi TaxID=345717 RepID=A0A821XV67_9NEOP|nr:unnamed protein product [Pieris macdunnoughi]